MDGQSGSVGGYDRPCFSKLRHFGEQSALNLQIFGDNLEEDEASGAKPRRRVYLAYVGALPEYVERLRKLAEDGYPGFVITR